MKERLLLILKRIKKFSFYRKKRFYIVLTVIFSLILLADVAAAVFVPAQSGRFGGMPSDFSQMEEFPGNGNESESGEMSMPEMPQQGAGESMLEMPQQGDGDSMPEMPEGMEMPDLEELRQPENSFLQVVKAHWLLIFSIFFTLDAFSIFMLIYISRKEKKQKLLEMKEIADSEGTVHPVRKPVKKEKHNQFMGLIVLGAMALLVIVVKVLTSQTETEVSRTEATVHSGTVETGSVSSVLPGTGTLTEETAEPLELPADVEITQWYVSNGDTVAEGDKIAQVDTVSVMSAIVAVQEKLALLDEELNEHENEEISDTITAGADGRVEVIYAQEDVGVVETMYDSGALMLISLDGMLAVSIETEAELSAGDMVTVTLSDSTALSGKVESVIDGMAVITVSDEETDYGESVTVTTEDGTTAGSGELYIHSELKVTGFTGMVSDIEVSVNEEVTSGEELITLTDTDYTGEYELLLAKRSELEAQMQTLFQLYQDQYVYASCAGVISGLDETLISADATLTSYSNTAVITGKKQSGGIVTLSSSATGNGNSGGMRMVSDNAAVAAVTDTVSEPDTVAEVMPESGTEPTPEGGTEPTPEGGTEPTPEGGTEPTPEGGTEPTPEGGTEPTPEGGTEPTPDSGTGTSGAYTSYIGTVTAVQKGEGTVIVELASVNNGGTKQLTLSASLHVYTFADGKYAAGNGSVIQAGNMLMVVYESGKEGASPVFCISISAAQGGSEMPGGTEGSGEAEMPDGSGDGQGTISQGNGSQQFPTGSASSADMADQTAYNEVMVVLEEEVENDYSVVTATWLSVTPQEEMEITITIDEMDILSLEEGQEALVTLDAFPGQSFEGTVTTIHLTGTNSGGSSKYEAVVSIERQENMLAGMNASVQITLDTKEGVLVIPEAALIEQESGVYVYTSYDEETETFGDLTEVTTGVSDGENVEILSGLSEGCEYWYSYLDVVNYTTFRASNTGSFSIDSMFSGGRGR